MLHNFDFIFFFVLLFLPSCFFIENSSFTYIFIRASSLLSYTITTNEIGKNVNLSCLYFALKNWKDGKTKENGKSNNLCVCVCLWYKNERKKNKLNHQVMHTHKRIRNRKKGNSMERSDRNVNWKQIKRRSYPCG